MPLDVALMHTLLGHPCPLWSPHDAAWIVVHVQSHALPLPRVPGTRTQEYPDKIKLFDWYSPKREVWDLLHGQMARCGPCGVPAARAKLGDCMGDEADDDEIGVCHGTA